MNKILKLSLCSTAPAVDSSGVSALGYYDGSGTLVAVSYRAALADISAGVRTSYPVIRRLNS